MRTMLLFLLLAATFMLSAEECLVARFENPSRAVLDRFLSDDYDVAAYAPGEYLDIVVPVTEYNGLVAAGYNVTVHISEAEMREHLNHVAGRPIAGYYEYDEVVDLLNGYVNTYPAICQLEDIGDSWGKTYAAQGYTYYNDFQHDIWSLKVSDNVSVEEDEPCVYFMAHHHAREPISTQVCLALLDYLLTNYGVDPDITAEIDGKQIWFIPDVNPDGGKIVLDQTDVWWRKNVRDNNGNHTFNSDYASGTGADGVDLNRNYGFTWGNVGSTDDPNGVTYHGPNEFSEPETQIVRDVLSAHHFVAGISYHSYGEEVLYPYGYADGIYAPDNTALAALGDDIAENIPGLSGGHYTNMISYALYPTSGGSDDWAYGVCGIFAYTVELAEDFIPAQGQIETICDDNIPGAMMLLDRIDYATLTGHITDATTGEPLQAEVYVDGIDNTGEYREPMRADAAFGRYWRILPPGQWDVTYRLYGYASQTAENVTIGNDYITQHVVELEPVGTTTFSGTVYDATSSLPIENAVVELVGTPFDPVETGADGSFIFADIALGTYTMNVTASGYGLWSDDVEVTENGSIQVMLFPPAFTDDFENGTTNWTTSGSWGLTTSQSYSPSHSFTDSPSGSYSNNLATNATLNTTIDLTDATSASVGFWTTYEIESGYDYCYLQVRNTGGTWTSVAALTGESDWTYVMADISDWCGYTVQMRFRFESDTYVTGDGVYIDDFAIYRDYPIDVVYGDVNDDTTITDADAQIILSYSVGLDPLPELDPIPWEPLRITAANVDGLVGVNALDASLVAQYAAGSITQFPVEQSGWTAPIATVAAQTSQGAITLSFTGELYGLNLTVSSTETFMPNGFELLDGEAYTAEYSGDMTLHYALASTTALSGDVLRIPYTLSGTPTQDVELIMNVNNVATTLYIDASQLPVKDTDQVAVTRLNGNFPNPFNPVTQVQFSLAQPGHAELAVYNARGQRVTTLVNGDMPAGSQTVRWNGNDADGRPVSSGLYFFRLRAAGVDQVCKGLLLK